MPRPFGVDRNIWHFLWYGGFAGEGLRSVGEDVLPSSKSVCSILPIARRLRAGEVERVNPGPSLCYNEGWAAETSPPVAPSVAASKHTSARIETCSKGTTTDINNA